MRHLRCSYLVLVAVIAVGQFLFGLTGCQTTGSGPAKVFATLKAAAAGIDSYRASYESAFTAGAITATQKSEADRRYNRANDAIIAAAKVARDGLNATTPAEVDQAVASFVELIALLVPPRSSVPPKTNP